MGRLAVHFKMITMDQLSEITRSQARGDTRRIGDILLEDGFITREYLAKLIKAQLTPEQAKALAGATGADLVAVIYSEWTVATGKFVPTAKALSMTSMCAGCG